MFIDDQGRNINSLSFDAEFSSIPLDQLIYFEINSNLNILSVGLES